MGFDVEEFHNEGGNNLNTGNVDIGGLATGLAGMLVPAVSQYRGISNAKDEIGQLEAYRFDPNTGYGLSAAKSAILNYNPIRGATTKDFGYDSKTGVVNGITGALSGAKGLSSINPALGGIGAALGFATGIIGDAISHRKATREVNKYNSELAKVNDYNYSVINSNLNNTKADMLYNSIYNSMAQGGLLSTQGSDWNTGLNYIGAGGSHEQNPNDGVQMGIAPDGQPNLVEEGEVIWNGDYVFSKRLKVPKSFKEKYKLGKKDKSLSYADAAMKINEEMEERPNDPISKRGRDANLARLAESQEEKRAKIQIKEQQQLQQQAAMFDMSGIPQEQMAMEQPDMMQPEEPQIEQQTPEQYMEQQSAAGMPLESMYAAKGGPIGHKYDDGSWKLTQNYLDWLNTLSEEEYAALVGSVYDPKRNPKRYAKYTGANGREEFFNRANYKSIGNVHRAISNAYAKANPAQPVQQPIVQSTGNPEFDFNFASQVANYGANNPYGWWETNPIYTNPELTPLSYNSLQQAEQLRDAKNRAIQRWNNYTGNNNVPTGIGLSDYILPFATEPIVESRDANGNPIVTNITPQGDKTMLERSINRRIAEKRPKEPIGQPDDYYDPLSKLRYMPAIGSGLALLGDLAGITNKPDYSAANAIARSASNLRNVAFRPLGDYAKYKPVDTMAMVNQLNANAGATRRSIVNTAGGNRGTAMAALLAADNAYNNSIGQAYINSENTNYDRYMKALSHNANINQINSQGFLQADMANQRMDEVRARYATLAADARLKALQAASAARSANWNNFFDNLGNIGIDAANRMDTRWLAQHWPGASGQPTLGVKPTGVAQALDGKWYYTYGEPMDKKPEINARGGRINRRKTRRVR